MKLPVNQIMRSHVVESLTEDNCSAERRHAEGAENDVATQTADTTVTSAGEQHACSACMHWRTSENFSTRDYCTGCVVRRWCRQSQQYKPPVNACCLGHTMSFLMILFQPITQDASKISSTVMRPFSTHDVQNDTQLPLQPAASLSHHSISCQSQTASSQS